MLCQILSWKINLYKLLIFVTKNDHIANSESKTFRDMLFKTNSLRCDKFSNEKLISISYVAFRHENRSFGEICFDIVKRDVCNLIFELGEILIWKFDFDQNCSFSTLKRWLSRIQFPKHTEIHHSIKTH